MARHSRARHVVKWVLTGAAAAMAVACVLGLCVRAGRAWTPPGFVRVLEFRDCGVLYSSAPSPPFLASRNSGWTSTWQSPLRAEPVWLPSYRSVLAGTSAYQVKVPLWVPLALVAIPAAYLWWAARRPARGLCPSCRYDRAGLPGGAACPECGARAVAT